MKCVGAVGFFCDWHFTCTLMASQLDNTPAHLAGLAGNTEVAAALLELGATVVVSNKVRDMCLWSRQHAFNISQAMPCFVHRQGRLPTKLPKARAILQLLRCSGNLRHAARHLKLEKEGGRPHHQRCRELSRCAPRLNAVLGASSGRWPRRAGPSSWL